RRRRTPARKKREGLLDEHCVERDGFSERHTDDALHEDFRGGTGIAADGFGGLEADESDANGGAEAAEAALDAAGDFSDGLDHDVYLFCWWIAAVRARGTVPAGKVKSVVGGFLVVGVGVVIAVVADEPDVNADEQREDEGL